MLINVLLVLPVLNVSNVPPVESIHQVVIAQVDNITFVNQVES